MDPCESNPCHEDATCQTLFNEESYKCICAEGYEGNLHFFFFLKDSFLSSCLDINVIS